MDLGDVSSLLSGGCSQESHCTSQHLASSSGSWFSSSPAGRKGGSRRMGQRDTEDEPWCPPAVGWAHLRTRTPRHTLVLAPVHL